MLPGDEQHVLVLFAVTEGEFHRALIDRKILREYQYLSDDIIHHFGKISLLKGDTALTGMHSLVLIVIIERGYLIQLSFHNRE